MQERTINISFPIKENILLSIKESKKEFTDEILYLSALYFYRKKRLSLGKAAELAGYRRLDFIEKLQREKEYVFDYDEDEIDEIFEDALKIT
jgi:predicted HTH domain antitoxin